MKFGRKLSYHKIKVKFEFEKYCAGRTQTASKRNFKNAISQKVSNRYQSNRAGGSVIVKYSNLKRIALIERKLSPKNILNEDRGRHRHNLGFINRSLN